MVRAIIESLPRNPAGAAVYKRNDGSTYLRLNERFHVKVRKAFFKTGWIGQGKAEALDPNEEVEVIYPRSFGREDEITLLTPMHGDVHVIVENVGELTTEMRGDPLVMGAVQVMVFNTGELMVLNNLEKDAARLFELLSYDKSTRTARIRKK